MEEGVGWGPFQGIWPHPSTLQDLEEDEEVSRGSQHCGSDLGKSHCGGAPSGFLQ